jgi:predicted kinase
MPTLFLVRGAPGSGKSTLAKKFVENFDALHFEADRFMVDAEGNYRFDRSLLENAHKNCQFEAALVMHIGASNLVVSNTFTRLWELQPYLDAAKIAGYGVMVIRKTLQFQNIHGVPQATVDRMLAQYEPYEGEIEIDEWVKV